MIRLLNIYPHLSLVSNLPSSLSLVNQGSPFLCLLAGTSPFLQTSLHPFPLQLFINYLGVEGIILSNLLVLQFVFIVTDSTHSYAGILSHCSEVLRHHPLLGLLLRHLAVDVLLADALTGRPDCPLENENNDRFWIMSVKELQATPLALVSMLLLHTLGSLDVNNLVKLQFYLVSMLGTIYHPRTIPPPEWQLLQLPVQDGGHLPTQAVVHVQGLVLSLQNISACLELEIFSNEGFCLDFRHGKLF